LIYNKMTKRYLLFLAPRGLKGRKGSVASYFGRCGKDVASGYIFADYFSPPAEQVRTRRGARGLFRPALFLDISFAAVSGSHSLTL
jgi:hypothetical protein